MRFPRQNNAIPTRLAELRQARGETQTDLAHAIGRSVSTVSRWEDGLRGIPDAMKERVAAHYGVSAAYLMGWTDDQPAASPKAA